MTTPEAHPEAVAEAVAVTEEMVEAAALALYKLRPVNLAVFPHPARQVAWDQLDEQTHISRDTIRGRARVALEAAAQVRSAQDHGGEANEMIGEPRSGRMAWHLKQAEDRATAAEARAAKAVEVLAKWQKSGHILLMAGEMTRQELRSVKAVAGGIQREVTATLLSDHPVPEPGVEAVQKL